MAAVHIDLDGARHIFRAHGWTYDAADDPLFESGLTSALNVLERAGVRATLFVIAEDMDDTRKRNLVRAAVGMGHEVASHSLTHRCLTSLGEADRLNEIGESRQRLASILRTDVRGFRAPGFAIDARCLAVIADAGYTYDSSLMTRSSTGGAHGAMPYRPVAGRTLLELPVPALRRMALPFHPSYSLVVGDWYFKRGVTDFRRRDAPFVLLFHLTDFAESLPALQVPAWRQQLFTLSYISGQRKRERCAAMLEMVGSQFTIGTTTEMIAAITLGDRQ